MRFATALCVCSLAIGTACGGDDEPSSPGETTSTSSTNSSATGGSGGAGGGAGLGGGTSSGGSGPCDPVADVGCIACGQAVCEGGDVCCGADPDAACGASGCFLEAACDGAEDCTSGYCCVSLVLESNAIYNGSATCGQVDCYLKDADGAGGPRLDGPSCRVDADCAGVVDGAQLAYPNCCFGPGFGVGVCVSDAFVAKVTQSGGSCG